MAQSPKNTDSPSVFLSHSSNDKDFVRKLTGRLRESKVNVWLDENELNIGDSLTGEVGSAVYECEFFAVVLSKNSMASNWVQTELQNALQREIDEKRVVVLPILLEEIELPTFLRGKLRADFTSEEKFEASFQKLLRRFLRDKNISDERTDKFFPNNFIPDLKFFVGRENLLENLKKKLDQKQRASIHDISGLGKTFTTYKFADEFQDDYERIFFVRVSQEEMLKNLAEVGVLLDPKLKEEPDQSKQAMGFKNWLENNQDWLVIYDNVDVPKKLFPYVPLNKKGDCLFTSNFPQITICGEEVTIKKLDKTDAEKLLFSRSFNLPDKEIEFSDEKEREAFEKIIEEIDGLPLSLNTTGAFISEKQISFEEFHRKLNRTPEILLKIEDDVDRYYSKSALKAFSIAFDDISAKKADNEFENSAELAQKLLFAASFIAPDNIPEELLKRTLRNIAEIDFEAEENEDLWQEIRLKSSAYDLLKYDRTSKLFNTHRLIQKVIETKLPDEGQKEIIQYVFAAIDELFEYSVHETKENCETYTPHAIVLIQKAEKLSLSSNEIGSIYDKIGRHLRETIKYNDSIAYFLKAINFYQTLSENEQEKVAYCYNELALVYGSQGKYEEAIKLYNEALLIDEKTIGKEHPDYATHLNNLALVYNLQGNYEEAIELFKEALLIDEKTIGKEHPNYATDLNNLANVYRSQGKYKEAIELYKEALLIGEKTIGKEHPDYATRLNNLANVYYSQGKYEDAEKNYKQVKQIREKVLGKEHPDTALIYWWFGELRSKQDRYEEALPYYEEALRIYEKLLPENHSYIQSLKETVARCREKLENK